MPQIINNAPTVGQRVRILDMPIGTILQSPYTDRTVLYMVVDAGDDVVGNKRVLQLSDARLIHTSSHSNFVGIVLSVGNATVTFSE